ncbi:MAG: hypothetical protein EPN65_22405 [Pandoraea sp.]|uniref:hypothetical protein n=1 Tax=Pandoraea sp. TaxID=1883445 RepID=UPI001217EAB1|nr:hypothetical protein [Pandoraea sp.]TAM13392.1 MAG: hypothetical protein EPN65_22405 [Pandoraea sp.]TAM54271.1 MAG: hypothetical protein EPN57_06530 [Paraburkholderia sp.]
MNPRFSATRRHMLAAAPVLGAALVVGTTGASADVAHPTGGHMVTGPVTFYAELRVMPSLKTGFDVAMQNFAGRVRTEPGFLSATLKQMSGESTMVKNYPEPYKGALANAYLDGVQAHTLPLFYSLFVRFASLGELQAAGIDAVFDQLFLPHLHPVSTKDGQAISDSAPMAVYRRVFETRVAGDRHGIYRNREELLRFLRQPADAGPGNWVTVGNHVSVAEARVPEFDVRIGPLLEVAQQTCQPEDTADGSGMPGSRDNRFYRKAISTEILREVGTDGSPRAYLMHGIWESVWDHENSHLDARFKAAAAPVGAMVEIGPVEPFYLTRLSVSAA